MKRICAHALLALASTASLSFAAVWNVSVSNTAFSPANLEILAGDTVQWNWVSGSHTTTSGSPCTADGRWNAQLNMSNPTFAFTFTEAGTYPYFCVPHCAMGMTGSVSVTRDPSGVDDASGAQGGVLSVTPNPARGPSRVAVDLPRAGHVRIEIVDAAGRAVALLTEARLEQGAHSFLWDGRTADGTPAPNGVYFAVLRGAARSSSPVILIR